MSVLLVCLVAVILLQPTEGCSRITDFTIFDPHNQDAEETCQKCPKCQPGRGLAVQCGSRVPYGTFTGCKQCEVNKTYSENNDISHCKPCNQCGFKIVLQQCTPMQNSKCADACIPGYKLDHIIDACLVVPVNKTATTSTKSPTSTKVPTAIPSLAPTSRSTGTFMPVGRIVTNSTNSTTKDPRTKLQSKPLNNYTTEPPIDSQVSKHVQDKLILGVCLGGVVIMVFIGFIIYCVKKQRRRSQSCEGLERGAEEMPLTEFQNKDHLVNKSSDDNGRTTPPLENHSHKNSATTSSTESVPAPAYNEESTGDDNPNLDFQRIPEDLRISDMVWLRDHHKQLMLFYVQDELDPPETLQMKTWRSVALVLDASTKQTKVGNVVEASNRSMQSPTEPLIQYFKTKGDEEPSMRDFVEALVSCKRHEVARNICNWPWEINVRTQ